jgi:hypothetical protein
MTVKTIALAAAVAAFALPAEAAPATAEDVAAATMLALGAVALDAAAQAADNAMLAPLQAVATGPVPEPKSWAMMILGFGLVGAMVRRRRLAPAA